MPPKNTTAIQGRIVRITFQNPENGYTVAKLQVAGRPGLLSVVGPMPGVVEGQEVEVEGREVLHPKFGPQVEVESVEVRQPSDDQGVRRYLASGLITGVGPKLADRLVDHLGPEALEIIIHEPGKLAAVPGIGRKRIGIITKAVKDHGHLRELMVFLQGHGVAASTALRIFRRYGAGALGVLQHTPHRLAAAVPGIGFAPPTSSPPSWALPTTTRAAWPPAWNTSWARPGTRDMCICPMTNSWTRPPRPCGWSGAFWGRPLPACTKRAA